MKLLNEKTGIIIQARSLSTRLPNKLFLPFYGNDSIIDVILQSLFSVVDRRSKIVLATTNNKADDIFIEIAKKYSIELFRGDEQNVLKRFINASHLFGIEDIIRICADNPLFDFEGTLNLLEYHLKNRNDYTAFRLDGNLPSIKSHLGFWGEIVSLNALEQVNELTDKPQYLEHVTNFIYSYPDDFKIMFIDAPKIVFSRKDIRLTVDTIEDFEIVKEIYSRIITHNNKVDVSKIINFVDTNPSLLAMMKDQIIKFKK